MLKVFWTGLLVAVLFACNAKPVELPTCRDVQHKIDSEGMCKL